jgi:hypothetical protein
MAARAKEVLGVDKLEAVADRGYYRVRRSRHALSPGSR